MNRQNEERFLLMGPRFRVHVTHSRFSSSGCYSGRMLSAANSKIIQSAIRVNCRCFSAVRATHKPKHHYVEHAPSERKIKRDERKKENQKLVDSYKKLDEEAAKSGMEKPWNYYLSL